MYLTQPLHKARRETPDVEAVIYADRRHTFAAFTDRVATLAGVLRGLGVGEGDRVGILALNSDRYIEAIFAALWAGGVFNTVNIRWSAAEIAYSLDDCDTRLLLVDDEFVPLLAEVRQRSRSLNTVIYIGERHCPPDALDYRQLMDAGEPVEDAGRGGDDLAGVLYTGGTTGAPKGVMLSHANLYSCSFGAILDECRRDRVIGLHSAPFFHVAGVGLILQLALRQGTHVVLPRFEERAVLEAIQSEQVGETFLVPTMIRAVLNHPDFDQYDLSSLHTLLYGASPIDSTLLELALKKLPNACFQQLYGMTELSPVVAALPPRCHSDPALKGKLASAGRPAHMAEVRVVDEQDNELPRGEVGEIVARGPMVMKGYWNRPEQTAEALRHGWMHTGDAGYMDADGYLFLVDRIKDMVVTGGENVYSVEVEDALLRQPAVAQCAVIGVPDDKWGERVHAVVVLKAGEPGDESALMEHCKSLIAAYKCPRSFEFVTELPLSGAGKILKYKLKEPHWAGHGRLIG
ncbi:long-chain-fatty-acid--CoA ligase [Alloalcanivorax mobilis]|uniref:long-chain-fatty-acid--CoA ligase n=1 Tax=Alloalcanivorax mobilis TaxID=2019569 RepID=UPI000B5B2F59|nr:long-chain-fatty-acid--CoA ligase [Alloalcanivorax mobilis]ASK35635.1 fatty-acid--CoA ligase [Alcanivorax sp. N3-2A]|tara:strand:- start:3589 stop:5142 length:1554 start_codon:yes stop_codon:yes gene_type:complete